ncbi:MAG: TolC family protein [Aquificota bacterium]|nr:TolC family protein [Aquificota bacterium]
MVILLLLLVSLSSGQDILRIDLKKAVELALTQNREILRIKKEILSLEDVYRAEKWDRFSPKIDLFTDRDSFTLFGSVLLLDFGNRLARIRSADLSVRIKRELLREFERQVKIRVVKLFMDLYLAEKLAEVKREEMAVAYVRFDRERERLKEGLSDRVKVAEWESTYRRFRAELLEAQRKYNETLYRIKRFLGIDVEKPVEIDLSSLLEFTFPEDRVIDPSYILKRIENHYLVKVKTLEIAYLESRAKEQRRVFYPELYGFVTSFTPFDNFGRTRAEANLVLRVPLFDGRTSFYREKSFLDLKRAVEIEKRDITERLRERTLTLPYEWEELVAEYQDAVAFDRWAQENLDLSRSNYELELAFDLGYAMSTKTEAERRVMEAKFRIILFLMRVYDLMGEDPMKAFSGEHPFFTERVEEI